MLGSVWKCGARYLQSLAAGLLMTLFVAFSEHLAGMGRPPDSG